VLRTRAPRAVHMTDDTFSALVDQDERVSWGQASERAVCVCVAVSVEKGARRPPLPAAVVCPPGGRRRLSITVTFVLCRVNYSHGRFIYLKGVRIVAGLRALRQPAPPESPSARLTRVLCCSTGKQTCHLPLSGCNGQLRRSPQGIQTQPR